MDGGAIQELVHELGLVANSGSATDLRQLLAGQINKMILDDFHSLVVLLYRVDINEEKLKNLLRDNPGIDAGLLIADLLIERQEQKIRSRRENQRDNDIAEEDKW